MNDRREKQGQDSGVQKNQAPDSARVSQEQRRTKETVPPEEQEQIKPTPDEPVSEPSGFMKMVKKVGYSAWLIVMVVGAALAFVVSLFLI